MAESEASVSAGSEISKKSDEASTSGHTLINPKKRQISPNETGQETPSKIQKVSSHADSGNGNKAVKPLEAAERPQRQVCTSNLGKTDENPKLPASPRKRIASDQGIRVDLIVKKPKRERENSDASYDDLNADDNEGKKRQRLRKKYTLKCVLEQMEFYFSDSNLGKDRYLKQMIDTTSDGYIDLAVFEKFNKLQSLHKDGVNRKLLIQALKGSTMLELNKEESKVRRSTPIKILTQEEIDARTVYVENLPAHANHVWLRTIFSKCGKVTYVSLPCYRSSKDSKGFAFVEYETPEEATKACSILNNPENLQEKPGKFPKWNNTLYRLQRFVPIQIEKDANDENIPSDKGKGKQEECDLDGEAKKKKKKKLSKKKSIEAGHVEERVTASTAESEATSSEKICASTDPPEPKKKRKKKKRRNSQCKDENATAPNTDDLQSSSSGSKSKPDCVKNRKKDHNSSDQNKGVEKDVSDNPTENRDSKLENEGGKKKRKKKKKKKAEPKSGVEIAEANSKSIVVTPKANEGAVGQEKVPHAHDDDKMKDVSTSKSSEISAEKPAELKLSAKERKKLRQADIQGKKQQRAANPALSNINVNNDVKSEETAATTKAENAVDDSNVGHRKSDGSELTSILKSKKAAERKKVEFDPVPITTEFEKTKEIRKRRKVKRDKLHLRVIKKHEWASLKAEYIARQKSHMAALKESLRELRQQENQNKPAKPYGELLDLKDVFKTKPLRPGLEFTPNVVVQWKCAHEMRREKLRTMFKEISQDRIAYIDAPEEARTGYIRFKDEISAEEFAKLSMGSEIFSARMLPADQQQAYWDKANEDRMKKLKSKQNEQGCDKLARKVFERNKATFYNKPSRVVFNDDEDDDGADNGKGNKIIDTSSKDSSEGIDTEINRKTAEETGTVENKTEIDVEAS